MSFFPCFLGLSAILYAGNHPSHDSSFHARMRSMYAPTEASVPGRPPMYTYIYIYPDILLFYLRWWIRIPDIYASSPYGRVRRVEIRSSSESVGNIPSGRSSSTHLLQKRIFLPRLHFPLSSRSTQSPGRLLYCQIQTLKS